MPARRRRTRRRKNTKKEVPIRRVIYLIIASFLLGIYLYFSSETRYWEGDNKISVVYQRRDGDVEISVFDPEVDEIKNIVIPGDTQVEVARNLGVLKLVNVNKLGINEGLEGRLLAETVTKYFNFPVYVWANENMSDFVSGNPIKIVTAIFSVSNTNLTFSDKIRLAFYSLKIKNTENTTIELAKTSYIRKGTLEDGQEGYLLARTPSTTLLSIFAEPKISKSTPRISIVNKSNTPLIANEVGEVVEVLGAKVTSITNTGDDVDGKTDCIIIGKNKEVVKLLSRYFSCKTKDKASGEFDVEMQLGDKFRRRF
jgi:hypothetical protein